MLPTSENEHSQGQERELSQERRQEREVEKTKDKSLSPARNMAEKLMHTVALVGSIVSGKGPDAASFKGNPRLETGIEQSREHDKKQNMRISPVAPQTRVEQFVKEGEGEKLSAATRKSAHDSAAAVKETSAKRKGQSSQPKAPPPSPRNEGTRALRESVQPPLNPLMFKDKK